MYERLTWRGVLLVASYWRDRANAVTSGVIKDNPGLPVAELRKKISAAYPFGARAMHPYKIWCDCVKKALKLERPADVSEGNLFEEVSK